MLAFRVIRRSLRRVLVGSSVCRPAGVHTGRGSGRLIEQFSGLRLAAVIPHSEPGRRRRTTPAAAPVFWCEGGIPRAGQFRVPGRHRPFASVHCRGRYPVLLSEWCGPYSPSAAPRRTCASKSMPTPRKCLAVRSRLRPSVEAGAFWFWFFFCSKNCACLGNVLRL